jgi:hypothetical protein
MLFAAFRPQIYKGNLKKSQLLCGAPLGMTILWEYQRKTP